MQTDKPNYYAILPAKVRYSEKISAAAKLLYAEISALSNKEGFCWATNKYFADLYKMDARSISRLVAELKDAGFITFKIDQGEQRRIFILDLPADDNKGTHDKNVYTPRQISPESVDKIVLHNSIINTNSINNKDVDMLITFVNHQFISKFKRKASEEDVNNFVNNCREYGTQKVVDAFTAAFKDNVSNWSYIEAKLKKTIVKKEIQIAADKKKVTEKVFKELTKDEAAETGKVIADLLKSLKMPEKSSQKHTDKRTAIEKAKPTPKLLPGSDAYRQAQKEFQDKLRLESN